ncbi:4-(cytidine 5'-diphospho)-2-C-methyl-D-erythritol kinase [Candidatus Sumerlaeota bacterium]|nr:4-(cytidine 5'-diphospho)-2-C-methyl-D-erythritol kinase [Candidatus Sumerlaeota bacterium]
MVILSNQVEVRAFAKINLLLRVTAKRPDGFHEVQTVLHGINLADELFFEALPPDVASRLTLLRGAAPEFERNLIGRAWRLLHEEFPHAVHPVNVRLAKAIPSGAGLGGGSADAAATLVALNRLFDLQLDADALERRAAQLGSDVPFFIRGGCQFGAGRGELLERLEPLEHLHGVVARPDVEISTAQAYGAFTAGTLDQPLSKWELAGRIAAMRRGLYAGAMENSFERALGFDRTEGPYAAVRRVRAELIEAGCVHAMLTGSGSAVFGVAPDANRAQEIAERMRESQPFSQAVRGVRQGWRWIEEDPQVR